jgi:hypothetical protein
MMAHFMITMCDLVHVPEALWPMEDCPSVLGVFSGYITDM